MKITGMLFAVLAFVLGLLTVSGPVFAHHGTNISYDHNKPMTLKGTVTEFVWKNPHSQLYFDVKDASGNIVHWAGELNSPGVLTGQGWNRKMFVPGDEITVSVFPSKAGAAVGVVDRSKPIIANGKEVVAAGRNVD
jgi:Family of unknown function (DUF6152)